MAVRDAWRAARTTRDLVGPLHRELQVEDARGSREDTGELFTAVVLEPEGGTEAVAQRRVQHAGAGRRPDQRERLECESHAARGRPLSDDQVEFEVLHRRVEDLLDLARQRVDLVDEEHVAAVEVRE